MIIDLHRFVEEERPIWNELEGWLDRIDRNSGVEMDLEEIQRFHYLYQRTSADLARVQTFASERQLNAWLERLVARAYSEIHESRSRPSRFRPLHWFLVTFPQTFRRHFRAFGLSTTTMMLGAFFGIMVMVLDPQSKMVLIPFGHLEVTPEERVRQEEEAAFDRLSGNKAQFSGMLMTHNTSISIRTLALGITYGIGTFILLFYNGIVLGAVAQDYVAGGQTEFLLAWLLPHGSIEIPAILVAGQAGLVLGWALIGRGRRISLKARMREVTPDLATLIIGIGLMLIWAGIIEAFLSQYHEPTVPYETKIAFGAFELLVLIVYLAFSGRRAEESAAGRSPA